MAKRSTGEIRETVVCILGGDERGKRIRALRAGYPTNQPNGSPSEQKKRNRTQKHPGLKGYGYERNRKNNRTRKRRRPKEDGHKVLEGSAPDRIELASTQNGVNSRNTSNGTNDKQIVLSRPKQGGKYQVLA